MKRLCFFLLSVMMCVMAHAQLAIADFKLLKDDMDARINYPKNDPDGGTCAIIKIKKPKKVSKFDIDTSMVSNRAFKVVDRVLKKKGEIWVYVPKGAGGIPIRCDGKTVMYSFPQPIEEAATYRMEFVVLDNAASFPGGEKACMEWLSKNISYPPACVEMGVQGRVMTSFVVEKDGSIGDIRIIRTPDPQLGKETVRLLKLMPNWQPAKMRGKPVRVMFTLPIMFRLT